jgi:penicillin-binding protein 1A
LRWLLLGAVTLALLGTLVVGGVLLTVWSRLPDVQSLRNIELQEPMYVYARDGRLIGLFGEMRRYPVDIKDVPLQVKQAFLAAEDARFYEHHGVDFKGVARAVWLLATTSDKRVPGGSASSS